MVLHDDRFDGRSSLMSTVMNGHGDIAEFLVKQSPDMLIGRDDSGRNCLHVAAEEDQVHMLAWLLEQVVQHHGRGVAAEMLLMKDHSQMNCLHKAILKKGSKAFMYLADSSNFIQLGVSGTHFLDEARAASLCRQLVTSTAFDGCTCLHLAAGLGKKKIITRLLEKWREENVVHLVHAVQKDGRTAAHSAANFGHQYALEMIYNCEGGSDLIFKPDDHGWTPLHWVADSIHLEEDDERDEKHAAMLQVKENKQAGVAIVEWICKKYDEMDREYSSISKHPLFQTENRGRTALHLAVRFGTLDLAEAIMKQAHQIGAADRLLKHTRSGGLSPMHCAAKAGRPEMIRLLLNSGAGMMTDDDGWLPLFWALVYSKECHAVDHMDKQRMEAVRMLRDHMMEGSKVNQDGLVVNDKYGISALQLACTTNHPHIVSMILEGHNVAEVSRQMMQRCNEVPRHIKWASKGCDALLFAARAGALSVVRLLLENFSVSSDTVDHEGRTTAHHACLFRRINVLEYLARRAEASGDREMTFLFKPDNQGATCLHLACGASENVPMDPEMVVDHFDSGDEGEDDADENMELKMHTQNDDDDDDARGLLRRCARVALTCKESTFANCAEIAKKTLTSQTQVIGPDIEEQVMQCKYVHVVKRLCELGGSRLMMKQVRADMCREQREHLH